MSGLPPATGLRRSLLLGGGAVQDVAGPKLVAGKQIRGRLNARGGHLIAGALGLIAEAETLFDQIRNRMHCLHLARKKRALLQSLAGGHDISLTLIVTRADGRCL